MKSRPESEGREAEGGGMKERRENKKRKRPKRKARGKVYAQDEEAGNEFSI